MTALQTESEINKFNKWRKEVRKTLPNLSRRIFALRGTHYNGCGFQWGLEKNLGIVIYEINNCNKRYDKPIDRIIVEVDHEQLLEQLEKIEKELKELSNEKKVLISLEKE